MKDRAHNYDGFNMEMVKFFEFFAIVPEIPITKHHESQEFGQNYYISAMKFSNFT
jgi:hypothetical protein